MKRLYIICFIFVFAALGAYFSYNYFANNTKREDLPKENIDEIGAKLIEKKLNLKHKEQTKINNLTTIKLQKYYELTGDFNEEIINTPVIFLEMTKEDLITYMSNYLSNPDREDVNEGIIAFDIIKFSKEEVVLRKTFNNTSIKEVKYWGYIENGYVSIYLDDNETIYDYTDISANILPNNLRNQFENGKKFYGIEELYEFLETYST